jgi:hypothetical protein
MHSRKKEKLNEKRMLFEVNKITFFFQFLVLKSKNSACSKDEPFAPITFQKIMTEELVQNNFRTFQENYNFLKFEESFLFFKTKLQRTRSFTQ